MARIVLLQCELEHRHQAPHLAMALYASDLTNSGHEVEMALVHPSALEQAGEAIAGRCDLLVLDSIFPFALVGRLRELSGAPVLVGGHNALQHALRGPADLALCGPGRGPLGQFVSWLDQQDDVRDGPWPTHIPGLWFRNAEGLLDCPTPAGTGSVGSEVFPFQPELNWDYYGPPRAPGSNLRIPSVVAELGCLYNTSAMGSQGPQFYANVQPRLPEATLTDRAEQAVRQLTVGNEGGCTFCVFRTTKFVRKAGASAIPDLLVQIRYLVGLGARGVSLQTEQPLPLLPPLLTELRKDETLVGALEELHVRTIPWLLLRQEEHLLQAIGLCRELGIQLVLGQVGFEAFDPLSLDVFHKGLTATDNRRAARTLSQLSEAHSDCFRGTDGHGLIPLHPWTSPEALATNLQACREDAPWLLPRLHPRSRLELYHEWGPLFWKAQDDGLIEPSDDEFGWRFRFQDDRTSELVAVWATLVALSTQRVQSAPSPATAAHVLLEWVLEAWRQNPEPETRKAAYMALRDRVVGRPA
ncbi:MAG TPA: hypothetical protein DIU15_11925 [Deltaproteobacteria bacterium]|nr:hypothetical protein [Deltaproteobacteria bacterium]HCP46746.1 hypothetical protein [Deltaproteobacteria bacterium]